MAYNDTQDMHDFAPTEQIIRGIVLPIICAFGILGLLLTVIVLSRKSMCTSINCYLTALAIADLLLLVILATTLVDKQIEYDSVAKYVHHIYIAYAAIFMNVFLMASVWMTVMLAVERYIAICHPYLATKMCTVTKARIIIPIIFFLMLASRMSQFWEHKVVIIRPSHNTSVVSQTNLSMNQENYLSTDQTIYYVSPTDLSMNQVYIKTFNWVVNAILMSILPFMLLLILNVLLICEVRKSTQYIQRNMMVAQSTNGMVQREELQITIMLISVIMVFFVCQAPYVTYTVIGSMASLHASTPLLILNQIAMLLLTVKSGVNFILYCWFSEKFRATLRRTFYLKSCWLFKKNYPNQNGNNHSLGRFSSCATKESTI